MVKEKIKFIHLDLLRGISAILVVCGHLRAVLFENVTEANNLTFFKKVFYFLTGLGHQAVIIFFVLSGFFIMRSILESEKNKKTSWFIYGINRLSRLWVVLIPAVFLTLIFDSLGYKYGSQNLYLGEYSFGGIIGSNLFQNLSIDSFFYNIFFMNGILSNSFGSNGALWSLPYEFWFYVIFPFIIILFRNKKITFHKFVLLIILILIITFIGLEIFKYFFIWCLGGGAILLIHISRYLSKIKMKYIFSILSIILFTIVVFYTRTGATSFEHDILLGFTSSFLIATLADSNGVFTNRIYQKTVSFLAEISFTVYAIHLPFILFIVSFVDIDSLNLELNFIHFIIFITFLVVILLYCYTIYYLFERNTYFFKKKLLKLLKPLKRN